MYLNLILMGIRLGWNTVTVGVSSSNRQQRSLALALSNIEGMLSVEFLDVFYLILDLSNF